MGVKERKEREKENLRQAIIDAAQKLFIQEGFENVTMRKIAEKIEYSPTTIYLYFKDKRDLFECLMEEYFLKLKQAFSLVYDENDDPITKMKKGMRAYINCGLENPNYYQLAFMNTLGFLNVSAYLKDGMIGTEIFLNHRNAVAESVRIGLFRQIDLDLAAQVIWTMNHGVTSLLISNPNFPWVNKELLISQSIESTIAGFLA